MGSGFQRPSVKTFVWREYRSAEARFSTAQSVNPQCGSNILPSEPVFAVSKVQNPLCSGSIILPVPFSVPKAQNLCMAAGCPADACLSTPQGVKPIYSSDIACPRLLLERGIRKTEKTHTKTARQCPRRPKTAQSRPPGPFPKDVGAE